MIEGRALELLTDARLSSDARVLGLYIASKGDGMHELSRDQFGDVLTNEASAVRVRRALGQLERLEYIDRVPGGRGHADSFGFRVLKNDTLKIKGDQNEHPKTDRVFKTDTLNAVVVEDAEEETPIVPFPTLSAEAEAAIEKNADKLKGCRDSLRDYLKSRVPIERQKAYVYTIVAWLDDSDPSVWRKPSGGWLEHAQRPAVLATAFNELGATNENKRKYDPGDPANLKTKISILLQQREDNGQRRHGNYAENTRSGGKSGTAKPGKYDHLEGADTRPAS